MSKKAVLFIIFNRPETTRRVFDAIRAYRPEKLFIAADGFVGASRAVPYRTDAVLAAAEGCGHVYLFDDETRLWHAWTSAGWRVDEDPFAPEFADAVEHLRARSEVVADADDLPF